MSNTKNPVICIGANKTGTTSLEAFFIENGFRPGNQSAGEVLIKDYARQHWKPILELVRTADFFQDIPFSARKTYEPISAAFPEARFILTTRNSPEDWYDSMMRFYSKMFSDGINPPRKKELVSAKYQYPGFMWEVNRALYFTPENDPFEKSAMIRWYHLHLEEARAFFEGTGRMLEVCIEAADAAEKIATFVGINPINNRLPHLNQSKK